MFNAYRAFVERSAKLTPIVAVLEDLHWADEPTLLLLQHLAQTLPSTAMLLIGTYRDVELDVTRPFAKTLETLVRQKLVTRISLRRLSVNGVESMLAAMSAQQPPPSLARLIFDETEGNPFFVEEVFRHLAEEGKLFDEHGKWQQGLRVDLLQVPEGVRLVLGRRLDRLGEQARRILTTAAIVGRTFSLRLLEELENQEPDAVLDAIEEAERGRLVSAEPAGRETRYRFVHELVRQTLAETLSLPRRQRTHLRIAGAIERVYAAHIDEQASPMAHHLYQAGVGADPAKAIHFLWLAAQRAKAGAAHEEALAHLDNLLSLCEGEESSRVAAWMEQKAATLHSIGAREKALRHYQRAIALYETCGAPQKAAEASVQLALVHMWRNDLISEKQTIDHALLLIGDSEPRTRINLLNVSATMLSTLGEVEPAARLIEEVRAASEYVRDDRLAAFNGSMKAHVHLHSMEFPDAIAEARRASIMHRAHGDLWAAAEMEWAIGYNTYCGKPEQAASELPAVLDLAKRVGHHVATFANLFIQSSISCARGDLRQAQADAQQMWQYGETHEFAYGFAADMIRGEVACLRGETREAERWYTQRPESPSFFWGYRHSSVMAMWAEEKDDRAWKAWIDRTWSLPKPGQRNPLGSWCALDRAVRTLALLGKREEAAALRPLCEALVATGVWASYSLFPFHTTAGIAAACAGDWAAAEHHHLLAIHQTDTAPYRVSQPMAREWYASMLLDRDAAAYGAKANDLLLEALAMYRTMDMPLQANRVSTSLAAR